MTPLAMSGRARLSAPGTPALEAYLLDFAGNLYGEDVELEFIAPLRGDRAFADKEALAKQMREDCDAARIVLRKIEQRRPDAPLPLRPRARKRRHWIVASPVARTAR